MTSVHKLKYSVYILSIIFLLNPLQAYSKDITAKVIKDTELDERITLFCEMYCVGNKKEGTLKSITVKKTDDYDYTVFGKAALRNRQVTGDYTLYDKTIFVNSSGSLNPESCELRVEDVKVENDFRNIVTNLIKSNSDVIGKVITVPDCKSFLQ